MAIERQHPTHETTLSRVVSWDSLEGQIDGIESEALFDVAAAPGVAVGTLGTISVSAVFGSAVGLTPHAERRERLAEASLSSDASWDSLESQIDGIESEALFLGRVDASASGDIGTITVSAIEGAATGETAQQGSKGGIAYRWLIDLPPARNPLGEYVWQREEEDEIFILF